MSFINRIFGLTIIVVAILVSLYQSGLLTSTHALYPLTLLLIGGLLGASLNYFHFGFSSSFRGFLSERKTLGMRAIILMLGFTVLLFSFILSHSETYETEHYGFIRPLSLSIPLGAFIFGIGMQISCGCTSGTLNRAGQLQPLALPTLIAMIIGGTLAAMTFDNWRHLPTVEPIAFQAYFSWTNAVFIQLLVLSIIFFSLRIYEKRKHHKVVPLFNLKTNGMPHNINPFLLAALSLGILNATLFLISGSPWSISSVFPFWGTQLIDLFSLPIDWSFWDYAMENQTQLNLSLLENPVSLTTIGVILGALLVTLRRGRNQEKCAKKALFASSLGGLIMGYSAVLASGCNIGAFFSGIASGSLHGWVWFVFALAGNWLGIKLRTIMLSTKL